MKEPAIPSNEKERLKALGEYQILDTLPEALYDDITKIASEICNTPIALVSLIDDKRQWFKSHHGLDVSETPKEFAYCAHAINEPDQILEVHDAAKDERFHDNPLAVGEPYVKFYAGAPLTDENGYTLGTLCVIDHKARELSENQKETLWALSRQVVALLKLRKENLEKARSDQNFTDLVENLGDGVFELDSEGRCIYANSKMLEMLNMELEEVLNTSIWKLIHEEDVPDMKTFYGQQFKNRSTKCYYEYRITPKEGKPLWLGQNTTMEYEGKKMVRLRSISRNLSENKELKAELEVKESLYRLVSENSSDLIALHEPDATYKFVSPSCQELLGYRPEELIGRNPYDFIHPEDVRQLREGAHQDTLDGSIVEHVQYRIQRKNGSYLWMESYAKPILNNSNEVISFQTSSRDISEKKLEEDRINKYKDGLTLLNELASRPFTQKDLIDKALKLVTNYFGLTLGVLSQIKDGKYYVKNFVSKNAAIKLNKEHPYDLADTYCDFVLDSDCALLVDEPSTFQYAKHSCWKDIDQELHVFIGVTVYKGREKYGTVNFSDTKKREEKFAHYEGEFIELFAKWLGSILESREERLQLETEKAKAESASLAKASFLSMMSHEIRTPLNGIIGAAHLLLKKDPNQEQLPHLNILKRSGDNLLAIVNDILDFNKIEEGKILLDETPFDLREILHSIHQNYLVQANEKQIDINLSVDDLLANGYVGDPIRISQILHNLMSNAIKFTHAGSVCLSVKKTNSHDQFDELSFEVSDTGVGIPKIKQKEIFEVFAQADRSTTRKFGGSGLGLSITKKLLELMKSDISLQSEEGKGSSFSFKLILRVSDEVQKSDLPISFVNETPLHGRVLLVEDNAFNRVIAKDFLTSWGCEIMEAENGQEALHNLETKNIDLVLLDLQMPVMDGYETIKAIRAKNDPYFKDLPVIALTASALGDTKEKVFQSGMNDFITKPFHPDDFYSKLVLHLKRDLESQEDKNITSHILARLKEKLGEGDAEVRKYLDIFAKMLIEERGVLQQAIVAHDENEIRIYAHKNKSSLKLAGLDKLAKEAEELEEMIYLKNPEEMIMNKANTHLKKISEITEQLTSS